MSFRLTIVLSFLIVTSSTARADLLWGINGHPAVSYPGVEINRQLDYVKDLGMTSYRVDIPDAAAADTLATLVLEGKKRGIAILPVITPNNIDRDKDSVKELYKKAHDLAVRLAARFKDDIRVWELGNEMETYAIIQPCEMRDDGSQYPCEWGPAGGNSALEYYGPRWIKVSAVLKGLSDGIAEVDPGLRKAVGTAGWGHTGAFERMHQDGIKWDISVWHMYGEDPEWAFKELARYERPIWVTELNNPNGSQKSEKHQVDGLKKSMKRLMELRDNYKVEAAHVYELLDETYWAPDFEAYMGLVRLTAKSDGGWSAGEPKPSYFAVRELIRGPVSQSTPNRECDLPSNQGADSVPFQQARFAFCLILGRDGDQGSLRHWTSALEAGASITYMMGALMSSDEFSERYSTFAMNDREYVGFLYPLLLGRAADGGGVESYAMQLRDGKMTRESVAIGMMTSSEFNDKHGASLGAM